MGLDAPTWRNATSPRDGTDFTGDGGGDADGGHGGSPVVRLTRRRALSLLGGVGAAVLVGCSSDDSGAARTATSANAPAGGAGATAPPGTAPATTATTATTASSAAVPTTTAAPVTATPPSTAALPWLTPPAETGGPFPADGSNQNGAGAVANVLDKPAVFRTAMVADLDGSNAQLGMPMTLRVRVGHKADRSPYAGAAVYVWHCNVEGRYSAYAGNMNGGDFSARSFLRAVGVADANGDVSFTSVLPGRYQGRATHVHVAVYSDRSLAKRVLVSQFAFDDSETDTLYRANSAYAGSMRNPTYNASDNVFADGVDNQLLELSGATAVDAAINILV